MRTHKRDVERVAMAITQSLIGSMRRNPDEWMAIIHDLTWVADGTRKWGDKEKSDIRIRTLARAAIRAMQECNETREYEARDAA